MTEYMKRELTQIGSAAQATLEDILSRTTEFSVATGDATGGSTTTLIDTSAVWEVNKWTDAVVEITDASTGKHYFVTITSNTADTLTFPAIAATVVAGDYYEIRMTLRLADIDKWGGTSLTGRDISLDLKALTDDGIKGLLKSIGDIAALENLITRIGQTSDVVVAAGATGSASAKLRRVTTDLDSVKTEIGALVDAAVAAGAAGSVSAKLRRLTTDIDALNTAIGATDAALVDAGAVGAVSAKLRRLTTDLDALNTLIGATDAALVDAGAVGAVSSKLRRLTTDVGALLTTLGATDDAIVAAGATGSVAAKLRRTTQGLEDLKTLIVLAAGTNLIGAVNPRSEAGAGQTPVGVTVTAASTQILAANASRKVAIITNDSDTTMYLAIGQAAVANQGIRLNANGGTLIISRTGDIYSTEIVNGILAAAGNKVATAQELN